MDKIIGIYKITNPKKAIYIGSSANINKRFFQYKHLQCKQQTKLIRSFIKYKIENHKFEIICECDLKDLYKLENYYGDLYDVLNRKNLNLRLPRLNETYGGCSVETKNKIRLNNKSVGNKYMLGYHHTQESNEKNREAHLDKHHSAETKRKMSITRLKYKISHPQSLRMKNQTYNAKKVINIQTNEIYNSATYVSKLLNMPLSTLVNQLNNVYPNKTNCEYL